MSDELRAIGQRWALQSDTTKEFQAEVASTAALLRIADALERIADAMTPAAAPSDDYERGRCDGALTERRDVLGYIFTHGEQGAYGEILNARHLGYGLTHEPRRT